ncbi:hypothetical protein GII36_00105 [Candidatus Mycosynbacter amalyticus]|uniref:Uncharacterized protein n=1 Tax=Candidatus Mycosynbacter amalyticus TaxID=2665156 RepID=A0A857MJE6_9BACT|nr:TrbC/VirB2 family protein [Candidatus Mycosynbacter amalyticus]QHN42268.1 hypothetical protein GII36_00105 [Candidatus Mycosynbacter amalyticus]
MKQIFLTIAVVVGLAGGTLLFASHADALNAWGACSNGGSGAVCSASGSDDFSKTMQNIINMMLYVLGVIAVIAIIIGGIRYATANGDASHIKQAKDTILYAVIGLIVAIMAGAIVNFVVGRF